MAEYRNVKDDESEDEEDGDSDFDPSSIDFESLSSFTVDSCDENEEDPETQVYSVVRRFIEDNFQHRPRYLEEWRDLILGDEIATQMLYNAIRMLETIDGFLPDWRLILNALTFSPPSGIRAMIVAHDPIPYPDLATGLAFSFPREPDAATQPMYDDMVRFLMGRSRWCTGISMARMKQALMQAGIETDRDINNFCYEHWAERGVLLWNSALTINPLLRKMHHNFWLPFTKRLLQLILEMSHKPILGMFWGSSAKEVYDDIALNQWQGKLLRANLFECYDHPTFSMRNMRDFMPMAVEQFRSFSHLFRPPSRRYNFTSFLSTERTESESESEEEDDHARERNPYHYRRDDEDDRYGGGDSTRRGNNDKRGESERSGNSARESSGDSAARKRSNNDSHSAGRSRDNDASDMIRDFGRLGNHVPAFDLLNPLEIINPFSARSPMNPMNVLLPGNPTRGDSSGLETVAKFAVGAAVVGAVCAATMNPAAGKAAGKAALFGLSFL